MMCAELGNKEVRYKMRITIGRFIFVFLAVIFSLCIIVQFFLAGMAVFVDSSNWMNHMIFVHLFGFSPSFSPSLKYGFNASLLFPLILAPSFTCK